MESALRLSTLYPIMSGLKSQETAKNTCRNIKEENLKDRLPKSARLKAQELLPLFFPIKKFSETKLLITKSLNKPFEKELI